MLHRPGKPSAMSEPLPIWRTEQRFRPETPNDLERDGWQRRHMVEPGRAQESIELYEKMGFEVMTQAPSLRDFGPNCKDCAQSACDSWVVVYTRKKR